MNYNMPSNNDSKNGAPVPQAEEQVAQVEGYYHSTIEQLDDAQLSTLGAETTYFDGNQSHQVETDGNSVRELICNASLIRAGIRLEDFRIPEELSAGDINALVRGESIDAYMHGYDFEDSRYRRYLASTLESSTFRILRDGLARERNLTVAAKYEQRKRLATSGDEWIRIGREEQAEALHTPLSLSDEEIEERAAHIDALRAQVMPEGQDRFVVLPTSTEVQAWWTDERKATARQALGLSAEELDSALAWHIVRPKNADTGMSVFAIRPDGQEEHWTAFTVPSIESADQFGWEGHLGARPAVLHDDNVGLAFGTSPTDYHRVSERRMLAEGHTSVLNQYALLGAMKAEALIASGATQPAVFTA